MAGAVYTYDIGGVHLSIAGILIQQGGGEGEFFTLTLPQGFDAKTGVHGDVVSYKLGAEVAEGKLTLLDPSPSNADLFALYQADKLSPVGAGLGDFLLEDINSAMEITGKCRIVQPPEISKRDEAQNFTWTIQVYEATVVYREREVTL